MTESQNNFIAEKETPGLPNERTGSIDKKRIGYASALKIRNFLKLTEKQASSILKKNRRGFKTQFIDTYFIYRRFKKTATKNQKNA